MRIAQQLLFQISCGFFHATVNGYKINKLLINCPILMQDMSKIGAKHQPVFIQIDVTFGFITLELLALFE